MWIINWLPEFLVHLIFLAGILGTIAGFVFGYLPLVNKYKLLIQVISVLILSLGVYLEGGIAEKQKWELRVKELEVKVSEAQAKSAHVNTQIVEKVVTQTNTIKVKGDKVLQYIDREVKVFDNTCTITEAIIKAHNLAALNQLPLDEQK